MARAKLFKNTFSSLLNDGTWFVHSNGNDFKIDDRTILYMV